MFSRKEDQ